MTPEWWTFQLCKRQHDSPIEERVLGCSSPSMSGYLPRACLRFTFTDAAVGFPGCITPPSILYVTARPATEAAHHTVLTGSSLHGGPQCDVNSQQLLLHLVRFLRASLALYGW